MRAFILALGVLVATAVSAEPTITVARGVVSNQSGPSAGTTSDSNGVRMFTAFAENTGADLILIQARNRSTDKNTLQYEIGLTQSLPINQYVSVYIRPNIGSIQPSGSASMNYVGIEPGVIFRPWANAFSIKTDYSWFTGLNTQSLDITMARVTLGYDLAKNSTVGLRRDIVRGDVVSETTWIGYTHRF